MGKPQFLTPIFCYRIEEAAILLDVSVDDVYRRVEAGELPALYIGTGTRRLRKSIRIFYQHLPQPTETQLLHIELMRQNPPKSEPPKKKRAIKREMYQRFVELSADGCTICGSIENLEIDHDHVTGQVRGWLCHNCNVGLGAFQDSTALLEKAMRYLSDDRPLARLPLTYNTVCYHRTIANQRRKKRKKRTA